MKYINVHIYLLDYKPSVRQGKKQETHIGKMSGNSQEKVRKNRSENCVATL